MVEPISALVAGGALAATVVYAAVRRGRSRLGSWRAAVRRLGVDEIVETPRRWLRRPTLTGTWEGLGVRLERYRRGKYESGTRIVIDGLGHGVDALSLRREGLGTRLFGSEEVAIGDPDFDARFHVQGPALLTLAVLPAATRERALRLLGGQVLVGDSLLDVHAELAKGVLEVRFRDRDLDRTGERFFQVLKNALALAQRLAAPDDLPAKLADNFQHEPEAGVRLEILLTLARHLPDHPATRRVLLAGRQDRNAEVRLRAAMALGDEGRKTLLALVADVTTDDGCAARAVEALGDRLPAGKVKSTLEQALAMGRRKQTARTCLDILGRRGHPGAQSLYLQALRDGDPQVAVAAARTLGRAGTIAAVAPLRQEATSLLPSALRSAARQAIAEIQSRLTGAAPGQLALAEGVEGALTLAAEEAGGLSLTEDTAEPTAGESGFQTGRSGLREG